MTTTTNLSITLLSEGQGQKEAAINTALNTLDGALGKMVTGTLTGSPRTLPDATTMANQLAIATDGDVGGTGPALVYSDGTVWRRVVDLDNTSLGA